MCCWSDLWGHCSAWRFGNTSSSPCPLFLITLTAFQRLVLGFFLSVCPNQKSVGLSVDREENKPVLLFSSAGLCHADGGCERAGEPVGQVGTAALGGW